MNKRINIVLPEKTVSILDRVTTKGIRSRFIDRAILSYVEAKGRHSLRQQLKAGYAANAERDLETAVTWFPLEEEASRILAASPKKKLKRA